MRGERPRAAVALGRERGSQVSVHVSPVLFGASLRDLSRGVRQQALSRRVFVLRRARHGERVFLLQIGVYFIFTGVVVN